VGDEKANAFAKFIIVLFLVCIFSSPLVFSAMPDDAASISGQAIPDPAVCKPTLLNPDACQPPLPAEIRRMSLYSPRNVFIITDDSWEDVAGLVPVTTWTWGGVIRKYPTLILYTEAGSLPRNYASQINGASITATSTAPGDDVNWVIDGSVATKWTNGRMDNDSITIDFGQARTIDELRMISCMEYRFNATYSQDDVSYSQLMAGQFGSGWQWNQYFISPTQMRYLKINLSDPLGAQPEWKCMIDLRAFNQNDVVTERFDADSTIHFLQLYGPDRVTLVGNTPVTFDDLLVAAQPMGAGLNENQIERIDPSDYPNYWQRINTIVYSEADYEKTLMASTYASLINAPLVVNSQDFPEGIFSNRNVVRVGDVPCPPGAASCTQYSLEALQSKYVNTTGADKLLLVNGLDLGSVGLRGEFYTEKCGAAITDFFKKNSLAAPFLAAGRHELLVFTNATISPDVPDAPSAEINENLQSTKQTVYQAMESMFNNSAKYMTVVASPIAIPDSTYSARWGSGFRDARDAEYAIRPYPFSPFASYRFPLWKLDWGRIYGVSVSDASSYIARDLFYDRLMERMYEQNEYSSFHIGTYAYGDLPAQYALEDRDYLRTLDYSSACSGNVEIGCERTDPHGFSEEDMAYLLDRQFVGFMGHGSPTAWSDALMTPQIPYMQLPVAIAGACSTSAFWHGKEEMFGINFLRKGSMAYYGTVGTSFWSSLYGREAKIFTQRGPHNRNNVGELGEYMGIVQQFTTTLGDPALVYRKVAADSMTGECNDRIDNDNDGKIDENECSCINPLYPSELPEPECNDGIDNDADGFADLQDLQCQMAACASGEAGPTGECVDGIDNDDDGDIDLADPACAWQDGNGTFYFGSVEGPQCDDGLDNDNDEDIDWDGEGSAGWWEDGACKHPYDNLEGTQCDDNINNDNDNTIDWDGGHSWGHTNRLAEPDRACLHGWDNLEGPQCDDGLDNDEDGDIDQASHGGDPACLLPTDSLEGTVCDDSIDNDNDGDADWDGVYRALDPYAPDPGCAQNPRGNEAAVCDDNLDNDGDGYYDWDGAGISAPDNGCNANPAQETENGIPQG
jgi:hypothetical protein